MNAIGCYKIQLFEAKEGQRSLAELNPIYQKYFTRIPGFREPEHIVADPFLFVKNDRLYLFYESKPLYHDAVIKMTSTDDLKNWTAPVVVLKESFHLSYPWVFEREGHIYMLPETCGAQSVRLYEADDESMTHFHFVAELLKQEQNETVDFSFSDSSIFEKDGIFYLHTTIRKADANVLKLYTAESFLGPYREHPQSPVSVDQRIARDAGCMFLWQGQLYRVAQDCVINYGDNVHVLRVETLTPQSYKEKIVKEYFVDTEMDFYKHGGHQLNFTTFQGKIIVATDAKDNRYFLLNRILHKLGFYRT